MNIVFLDMLNTERFSPSPMEQSADQWLKRRTRAQPDPDQLRISKKIGRTQQIDLAKAGHMPTLDLKLGAIELRLKNTTSKGMAS